MTAATRLEHCDSTVACREVCVCRCMGCLAQRTFGAASDIEDSAARALEAEIEAIKGAWNLAVHNSPTQEREAAVVFRDSAPKLLPLFEAWLKARLDYLRAEKALYP